jgi:hypothetical protein
MGYRSAFDRTWNVAKPVWSVMRPSRRRRAPARTIKIEPRLVFGKPGLLLLATNAAEIDQTSALVSCLDLVISVDTSVAHLAGALGRRVWILLPYTPDYRWTLDREDSPWYPTARLVRQTETRVWSGVLERVRVELGTMIEDWKSKHRAQTQRQD